MKIRVALVIALLSSVASAATTTPPKVVFFGDATTAILSTSSLWNPDWINLGVEGTETTAQELARFPEVLSVHPNIVHIIPGTGDILASQYTNQYSLMPQIEANVSAMVTMARNNNIKVILGTTASVFSGDEQSTAILYGTLDGPDFRAMNAWIESYGAAHNIPVENYHDLLCGFDAYYGGTYTYAYGCVGSTNPNQMAYIDLPPLLFDNRGTTQPSANGAQAIIFMAKAAIDTMNLTLKGGYLSNQYLVPLQPFTLKYNVNTVVPASNFPIQFVPIGVYSDGVARPIVNTNFQGENGVWASNNPDVMYINQDGTAVALAPGKATITYMSLTGVHFATWIMYVNPGPPTL